MHVQRPDTTPQYRPRASLGPDPRAGASGDYIRAGAIAGNGIPPSRRRVFGTTTLRPGPPTARDRSMNGAGRRTERRRIHSGQSRARRRWSWQLGIWDRALACFVEIHVEITVISDRIAELDAAEASR